MGRERKMVCSKWDFVLLPGIFTTELADATALRTHEHFVCVLVLCCITHQSLLVLTDNHLALYIFAQVRFNVGRKSVGGQNMI
jgi:hypothetical protein